MLSSSLSLSTHISALKDRRLDDTGAESTNIPLSRHAGSGSQPLKQAEAGRFLKWPVALATNILWENIVHNVHV